MKKNKNKDKDKNKNNDKKKKKEKSEYTEFTLHSYPEGKDVIPTAAQIDQIIEDFLSLNGPTMELSFNKYLNKRIEELEKERLDQKK